MNSDLNIGSATPTDGQIRRMAGNIYGTNVGKVFFEFVHTGTSDNIKGVLRLNEENAGLLVFDISGSFDGTKLSIAGQTRLPESATDDSEIESSSPIQVVIAVDLVLSSSGSFNGRWSTTAGNAGTAQFFPHDHLNYGVSDRNESRAKRLHVHSADLGVLRLALGGVRNLINFLQDALPDAAVIVSYEPLLKKERVQTAPEFLAHADSVGEVRQLRLDARASGPDGLDRTVSVQLGQFDKNEVRVTSGDEIWVTGILGATLDQLKPKENWLATKYRTHGNWLNSIVFLGLLVWLPGIPELLDRAYVTAIAVAAMVILQQSHQRMVPLTVIQLGMEEQKRWEGLAPGLVTGGLSAVVGAAAVAFLTAFDASGIASELLAWLQSISTP